jgi:asparagine synthase (glutamine-hydrolysing)
MPGHFENMCGIFGVITSERQTDLNALAVRAVRALAHRGPDDEGIEPVSDEPRVVFGHRRLAILDLSSAGRQPMRDEATGNWITYNGEVFNFRAVREGLLPGARFQSQSDTEVVLKAWGLRGEAAIADWRGMFAFGLWQPHERRLTLVRDRLGIKPLYYFYDGETFLFASELRALLATGRVPRRVSRAAIESYLSFGSIEQPLTILENVFAVLPGHTLTFEEGNPAAPVLEAARRSGRARRPFDRRSHCGAGARSRATPAGVGRAGRRVSQRRY